MNLLKALTIAAVCSALTVSTVLIHPTDLFHSPNTNSRPVSADISGIIQSTEAFGNLKRARQVAHAVAEKARDEVRLASARVFDSEDRILLKDATAASLKEANREIGILSEGTFKNAPCMDMTIAGVEMTRRENLHAAERAVDGIYDRETGSIKNGISYASIEDACRKAKTVYDSPKGKYLSVLNACRNHLSDKYANGFAIFPYMKTDRNSYTAVSMTDAVWNFAGNTLRPLVTRSMISDARRKVDSLDSGPLKTKLTDTLEKASADLAVREKMLSVRDAVAAVYNASDGTLRDGVSREQIDNAKQAVISFHDGAFKEYLLGNIELCYELLTERKAQEQISAFYDSESDSIAENVTYEQIDAAQPAVDAVSDETVKAMYQGMLDKSRALLDEHIAEQAAAERDKINDTIPYDNGMGSAGCLYIPDVGLSVPLNWAACSVYQDQAITDAPNSAICYQPHILMSCYLIGDHHNQGFDAMKSSEVGYTKAYIVNPDGSTDTYICTANFLGHNTETMLTDSDYNDLYDANPGGLCMYTCNENWMNITVTFWQPV